MLIPDREFLGGFPLLMLCRNRETFTLMGLPLRAAISRPCYILSLLGYTCISRAPLVAWTNESINSTESPCFLFPRLFALQMHLQPWTWSPCWGVPLLSCCHSDPSLRMRRHEVVSHKISLSKKDSDSVVALQLSLNLTLKHGFS